MPGPRPGCLLQHIKTFMLSTLLEVIVQFLQTYGLPRMLTFDRDPRFVGSSSGRDFPWALLRFLLCVGVEPNVCPPQRPDQHAYVERLHRTLSAECLLIHRPTTLEQVREVTTTFQQHYNTERPHQGRACNNVPPTVAFPTLPKLIPVPAMVNPDHWLERLHRRAYARKVGRDGQVVVNHETYYVPHSYAQEQVVLFVNAPERTFDIWHGPELLKRVTIRGLYGEAMPFERYVAVMMQEARSEERRAELAKRSLRQLRLWN
jgi:integrase-like protein